MVDELGGEQATPLSRPEEPSWLTGPRRVLVEALSRRSPKGGQAIGMYFEALRALDRKDGPEALHVAAYELREFMNGLPRVLDLPIVPYVQMRNKAQSLLGQWRKTCARSSCINDGKWEGQIDKHLRRMLIQVADFADWMENQVPSRRIEVSVVLKRLVPTEHPMPAPLLDMRISEWSELLEYFNGIAHHNATAVEAQFRENVERLEVFLLEHLEPRTFEDQDAIDRLIAESEAQDDS